MSVLDAAPASTNSPSAGDQPLGACIRQLLSLQQERAYHYRRWEVVFRMLLTSKRQGPYQLECGNLIREFSRISNSINAQWAALLQAQGLSPEDVGSLAASDSSPETRTIGRAFLLYRRLQVAEGQRFSLTAKIHLAMQALHEYALHFRARGMADLGGDDGLYAIETLPDPDDPLSELLSESAWEPWVSQSERHFELLPLAERLAGARDPLLESLTSDGAAPQPAPSDPGTEHSPPECHEHSHGHEHGHEHEHHHHNLADSLSQLAMNEAVISDVRRACDGLLRSIRACPTVQTLNQELLECNDIVNEASEELREILLDLC
ncbi:hypothetical protein H696_01154 [Fonticula alba]|uniref:Uncharacterized protein n=1 Tax=Fonticula alba TaxID=691883 RepID=A0A058ZCS4_FONAL|nr:hypothetical protein H696_01154 [Fonticula alba]KCV71733.1 hypothetical protein H696_01154 [Fonticula alba]|eukprot:XP_009493311.1 hypothetical protein H696_01154 [Fonticula alba]